jgi:hypothetical protein
MRENIRKVVVFSSFFSNFALVIIKSEPKQVQFGYFTV